MQLLYAGRLSPRKGVDVAVRAVAVLASRGIDVELTVLGATFTGYEWFERELRELAAGPDTAGRVRLVGFEPSVWPRLAAADIALVPSVGDESFGNAAVEAVLAGRPSVVSAIGGLREAASGFGSVEFVAPGDVTALADAVAAIARGWSSYAAFADTDAVQARRRHDPSRYRHELVAALDLASRGARGSTVSGQRVAVAVLTYKRADDITAILPMLLDQARSLPAPDTAYVLVVDNDPAGSARSIVRSVEAPDLRYVVEPRPGISAARDRALDEAADADLLVFIDDDERPTPGWLETLLRAMRDHSAAAVAATVVSHLDSTTDPWIEVGGFFERRHRIGVPTGTPIDTAATNNLLLDMHVVRRLGLRFDPDFGLSGGHDSLFTRELTLSGERMVWCAEAVVTESVPVGRLSRRWVLVRSVSSGNSEVRVELRLADGVRARALVRVRNFVLGLARVALGGVRALAGLALGALGARRAGLRQHARGMRTAARGAGITAGAVGWKYHTYGRPRTGAAARTSEPATDGSRRAG